MDDNNNKDTKEPPTAAAAVAATSGAESEEAGKTAGRNDPPKETTTTQAPPAPAGGTKKEKKIPEGLVIPPKKPKLSKAERRALQEQQRAAKAAGQPQSKQPQEGGAKKSAPPPQDGKQAKGGKPETSSSSNKEGSFQSEQPQGQNGTISGAAGSSLNPNSSYQHALVPTLPPYRDPKDTFEHGAVLRAHGGIKEQQYPWHPAVIALGYKYATGEIRGGNARCRHMLACFETVLTEFTPVEATTNNKSGGTSTTTSAPVDYRHVLDQQLLKSSFQFWTEHCRPHSVSMGNAFTALKAAVASLDRALSFEEIKAVLLETISAYRRERIDYADRAIADLAHQKLFALPTRSKPSSQPEQEEEEEEVILTYGYSEVVDLTLRHAAMAGNSRNFRVIVVDSLPLREGRRLLTQLRTHAPDISCTYVMLKALTYVLEDVTKVLLGASALMSDGSVWGRAGTACVALAAHAKHIPVLVCSETYKISNRVQLESLTANELGSPYDYSGSCNSSNSRSSSSSRPTDPTEEPTGGLHGVSAAATVPLGMMKQLNLLYDLTPPAFVSGIVTELGIIPPSSVAVLLRELNQQEG